MVNPANYKISVTTRDPANQVIDGPTPSTASNIRRIGSNDIADNAVTTTQIANGAVTNPKIANFAVTNLKIADDALSLSVFTVPGSAVNVPPGGVGTATADCFSGETLIGGGSSTGAANAFDIRYIDSLRVFSGGEFLWQVRMANAGSGDMTLQSIAYCIPSSFP